MIVTLGVLAWMPLQEVGFDIVSMWSQMGFLAKGILVLLALAPLFLTGLFIWWAAKRKEKSPDGSRR